LNWHTYGSGHLHGMSAPDLHLEIALDPDALHRETQRRLSVNTGDHTQPLILERGYTATGQLDHLALRSPHRASEQHYQYDALGRMTFRTQQHSQGQGQTSPTIAYNYDKAGRLIASQHGHDAHRYPVDAAGNRSAASSSTPNATNQLAQLNGTRYRYDSAGNLIHREHESGERLTLGYDGANRLVTLTRTTQRGSTTHASYRYDGLGRRISKTVRHTDGTTATTHYGWDGDRIIREETNNQRTTVVYEPGSFVPMLRIDQGNGNEEKHLSAYITDALGTPLQLLSPNGQLRWLAEPDDWAAVKSQRAVRGVTQPIRFQGQWHDEESGLYYNRHRYYDPEQGRYISQDPIGLNGGYNLYQYAASPIMEVDPLGLSGVYGLSGSRYSQPNMVRRMSEELETSLSGGLTGQAFGGVAGVSASHNKIIAPNGAFNSSTVCWQLGAGVYAGGGGSGTLNLSSDPVSPGVSDSLGAFFSGGTGPVVA
ncbi:RHS repeat-associated core domain-containing protein, partial [Vreelandella alkaliphila]